MILGAATRLNAMSKPSHKSVDYRPEVDGLRALAVLPVLVYHLSGGGWLDGGFLGVDVFFVISGYLITRILVRDFERNAPHPFRSFWARRIRRIFPLVGVVVLATTVASWFLLAPKALREFIGSGFAATFSYSNLFFWSEDSYISEASTTKPLLHTWSLAVEEQFYIIYPILLLVAFRLLRKPAFALWAVLALSVAASLWVSTFDGSLNFYSFATRAWELAAGALVALAAKRSSPVLAGLGLLLIATGYIFVKDSFWHPSPTWTLLPVIGSVLVIRYAAQDNVVGRLLSWKPLVAVGLISFGIYLWHWPIIAFFNYSNVSGAWVTATELVLPILLAIVTYFLVEKPFRDRTKVSTRAFTVAMAALLVTILASLTFTSANASTNLRLGDARSLLETFERSNLQETCGVADDLALFNSGFCKIGDETKSPDFLLFGDSHAFSLLNEFDLQAADVGRAGLFAYQPGCVSVLGVYEDRSAEQSKRCHELNLRVEKLLEKGEVRSVYLVSRWNGYWDDVPTVRLSKTPNSFGDDSREVLRDALELTLARISTLTNQIVLFEDTPPQAKKPELLYKDPLGLDRVATKTGDYITRNAKFRAILGEIKLPQNVQVFDPKEFLCDEKICPIGTSEQSYYFDDDHLSIIGAGRLGEPIAELLSRR